jgi:hypothetical protein
MESRVQDMTRIIFLPEVTDTSPEGINVALTEKLLEELKDLLSLEKEKETPIKAGIDWFSYYKSLLLRLKDEKPDVFWGFVNKANETEQHSAARAGLLAKGWKQTASSSKLDS